MESGAKLPYLARMKSRFRPLERFHAATLRNVLSELDAAEVFLHSAAQAEDTRGFLVNRHSGRVAYDRALLSLHMLPLTSELQPLLDRLNWQQCKLLELGEEF